MKTVVVGISGGVDSAVAAYLLKEQGYRVLGLFMRNWDSLINNDIQGNYTLTNEVCAQEEDYNDAKVVCKSLDIPLHRVEFIKEYWDYVFTYFLEELKQGRTPNPDLFCNKYIKFDLFIKEALKLGADYIATGHYARIIDKGLYKAIDLDKDQTYFLSQINKAELKRILFPLGSLTKSEVRTLATKIKLKVARKRDSTGICFIGERNFPAFLSNYFPKEQGIIIDIETKKKIGEHQGLMYYTIGQRKGLGLPGGQAKLYVVGKNLTENILYVATGSDNEYLKSDEVLLTKVNFLSEKRPKTCQAKFRYRQSDQAVTVTYLTPDTIKVKYNNLKAVTPGQACVLYLENECLGGGIITTVYKKGTKMWYL